MKHLTKLSERMFVDLKEVSFMDLERKLDTTGPSYLRAKVIVSGHQVIMNETEAANLMEALQKAGHVS